MKRHARLFLAAALLLTLSKGSEVRADWYFPTSSSPGVSLHLTTGDVVISWDKTLTGAVDVEYSSDLSSWTTLSQGNNDGSFQHALVNATKGFYRLRPVTSVPPQAPTAVKNLAVTPTGVGSLTVSWDAPSEGVATSYTVTMTTQPLDQEEATEEVFVTTTPSLTVGNLSPYDTFFFEVSASNSAGTGDTTVISYSATTSFLAIASFTMNPTAMLAASDGSVWIGYEDSLVPTIVSKILNGVTQIPVPQNLSPQVRQYVLRDGAWEHRATILTEGVSYGLTEDKNGDIWTANNTTHQSWFGHLFPNVNTSGVVQRITSTDGSYGIAETLDLEGAPLPETLITMPSGDLYVSVYGNGLVNGVIQGIAVHPETSAVFNTSFGPYMHPIVSLAARDGELWALESVPSGRFWDIPSEESTHSVIRRIDLDNLSDHYFKWVSPGASAIALLPHTDSTTSSVAIADHHRVLKVTFNGNHLNHDGDLRLEGQVKSLSFAADGSLWAASRGKFGAIKEQLFLLIISSLLGTAVEISVEIDQALGALPEPEGKPGFIQQIWTPWQSFVAGEKLEFLASTRMAAGVNAPLAAPISSGMWVRSANQPLFLPSTPFQPHGLAAVFGPGPGQITLSWEAPDVNGGADIVGYSVTAAQGANVQSMSATGTSVTFDGLSWGDSPTYFTVTASNFIGESNAATLFIDKYGTPIPEKNTVVGMSTDGELVLSNGYVNDLHSRRWGLDGFGNTYSYQAMGNTGLGGARVGSTLVWNGVTFNLPAPNQPNFIWAAGQTIDVAPSGNTTLNIAGAGVNGSQQNQQITLTFTDGSSVVWTQSFSDWGSPQNYGHEAIVSTQSYRNTASGGTDQFTNHIYGYSYTIPVDKTLASITLPNNPNLRLLDIQMSNSTPVNLSGAYTSWGIANGEHQVANLEGFDGGGYYYYSGDLESTITWSGATFQFGPVPNSSSGQNNFVQAKGQTIDLPQGDYGWLYLAGAAANGNQQNQEITLTFTDGSMAKWTQSFSDWTGPQNYAGETIIQMQPNWVNQVGNVHPQTNYVFGYACQIPAGKTLASITLPNNQNVGILGMTMVE